MLIVRRRTRFLAASFGSVLCALVALLVGSDTTARASSSCPAGAVMNIVAHPDDDLLFLSPDVLHDVQGGRCVRTVVITAGERGDINSLEAREAGLEAAYAQMAGVSNAWTTADAGVPGHAMPLLTLSGRSTVSLVFMRLPEGFWGDGGTTRDQTLQNLWLGTVSLVNAEDGTSSYTSTALTSALTTLMSGFQPDTIRTQDYVGTFGDGDHDDHHAAAFFARRAASNYTLAHTIISYDDYDTEFRPQNVFDPDLTAKKNAFNAYLAYDSAPCGSPPNCGNNEYSDWLKRQYVLASESGSTPDTTPPTVAAVSPADGATGVAPGVAVTASFSEPVDAATVSASTFTLRDPNGGLVAASIADSGAIASLRPSAPLASSTSYTATLSGGAGGIKDPSGNALANDVVWSFTTGVADTTPPSATLVFPAASGAYTAAAWSAGCPSAGFCGSASDAGTGVAKVELSIRRSNGAYWNGTSFAGGSEIWLTATGTTSWRFAFAGSSFPAEGTYTTRLRATDNAGNVAAPVSTSFVYDATSPSSTVVFPVPNHSYTTSSWNAGCASPGVCGTSRDLGSGVQKVAVSIRQGKGNYWDGTSFASRTEVFLPATGTTSWSFAFPASSFPPLKLSYTVRVAATDNAGNVQSPSTTKFSFLL